MLQLQSIIEEVPTPLLLKTAVLPGTQAEALFLITDRGELFTVRREDDDWCLDSFLSITDIVTKLHGVEFHGEFSDNGRLYLHYTTEGGFDTVEEWVVGVNGTPICVRTLLNIKQLSTGKDTLKWVNGRLAILLSETGRQEATKITGKLLIVDVDSSSWRFKNNPPPVERLDQLDKVRRSCINVLGRGLVSPTGLEVDGASKYLMDGELSLFMSWRQQFERENSPQELIGGKVYYGDRIEGQKGNYIFADCEGRLFSFDDEKVTRLNCPPTPLTAIGSNTKRTRLFAGGETGLYEILPRKTRGEETEWLTRQAQNRR